MKSMSSENDDSQPLINKVVAFDFPETGRGNAVTEDVQRGDVLLEIPLSRCFSLESAQKSEMLTKAMAKATAAPAGTRFTPTHDQYMAMFILLEQNLCKQSSHYEHILSLPKAYDLPLFWSEEERKRSLFGTTTYAETLALDDEVIQDYELLKHHLGEDFFREQNITMDRFKWVRATLWSRQCDLLRPAPETTRLRVLVPEFDMFNHSSKVPLGSSHKLNYSRGLVTAFATANVPKGEQAYISYGSGEASSSKLLLWYGFAPLNEGENPFEQLDVTLTSQCSADRAECLKQALFASAQVYLRKIDSEWEEKKKRVVDENDKNEESMKYEGDAYLPMVVNVLHAPNGGESGEFIVRHSLPENNPLTSSLLAYARVQFLTEQDCRNPEIVARMLNSCSKLPPPMPTTTSSSSLPYDEYIMDDANEVGALATTVSLLESIRKNQPWFETPEESERLAQDDSNPDFHARCAARVRGVEKRIVEKASTEARRRLHFAIQACLRKSFSIRDGFCGHCDVCKQSGCPWVHVLAQKDGAVQSESSRSSRVAISGIEDMLPLRAHLQVLNVCFLWMTGHVRTSEQVNDDSSEPEVKSAELLARAKSHEKTWPMREDDPMNERSVLACDSLDALAAQGLDGSNGEPNAHNGEEGEMLLPGAYNRILRNWSSRLFSQLTTSHIFSLSDANAIAQESSALRKRHALSVPTSEALAEINKYSPVLEMCCGSGLWSRRLHEIGCDVTSYTSSLFDDDVRDVRWFDSTMTCEDEKAVVVAETLARHKTLVLMWIDKGGEGNRGLDMVQCYEGDTLILVGEWSDRTYGSYVSFLPESGASFSKPFQKYVEENFSLVNEVPVGNWPMYDASLRVWKRREPFRPKTP